MFIQYHNLILTLPRREPVPEATFPPVWDSTQLWGWHGCGWRFYHNPPTTTNNFHFLFQTLRPVPSPQPALTRGGGRPRSRTLWCTLWRWPSPLAHTSTSPSSSSSSWRAARLSTNPALHSREHLTSMLLSFCAMEEMVMRGNLSISGMTGRRRNTLDCVRSGCSPPLVSKRESWPKLAFS